MMGYFARMLRSAAGAEPALRPLAGSVFAAPLSTAARRVQATTSARLEADELSPAAIESTAFAAQPKSSPDLKTPAPSSYAESYVPLIPQVSHGSALHRDSFSSTPADADEARRIRQPHEISLETHRHPEENFDLRGNLQSPATRRRDDAEGGAIKAAPERAHVEVTPATPVLNAAPRPESNAILQPLALHPATKSPTQRMGQPARVLPLAEPEVQIHIGRIEVLAAPPAPPRAPAPRPNRSTTLAEYLSRRGGGR